MTTAAPAVPGPARKLALPPDLVAALDLVRVLAALVVVIDHLGKSVLPVLSPVARFGQEAVIVFFLLSGFVIMANEQHRMHDLAGYAGRRIRRIWPLLLVAMAVSTLVAWDNGTLAQRFELRELVLNLGALQDASALKPGVIVDSYLDNAPLWSLSYEVFFYLVFPLVLAAWTRAPRATNAALVLLCPLAFALYAWRPGHLSLVTAYFMLWWSGALAADALRRGQFSLRGMAVPVLGCALLVVVSAAVVALQGYRGLGVYPFLMLRHFAGALLMLLALVLVPMGAVRRLASRIAGLAAFGSSLSYGIYVLHYPIMVQSGLARSGAAGLVLAGLLVGMLAWLGDRQLNAWLRRRR